MLSLDAFSGRDLQHMRMLLQQMIEDGVSVSDALSAVNKQMSVRMEVVTEPPAKHTAVCPSCRSPLILLKVDGLPLIICKKCRWSAIMEDK